MVLVLYGEATMKLKERDPVCPVAGMEDCATHGWTLFVSYWETAEQLVYGCATCWWENDYGDDSGRSCPQAIQKASFTPAG